MPKPKLLLFLLFLTLLSAPSSLAQNPPDWLTPFPPHRVIANIYYVGSQGLASYLIATPATAQKCRYYMPDVFGLV